MIKFECNDPVLLRDILPFVMADIDRRIQRRRSELRKRAAPRCWSKQLLDAGAQQLLDAGRDLPGRISGNQGPGVAHRIKIKAVHALQD